MKTTVKDAYDKTEGYCRMLGHAVTFRYCRTVSNALPCRKIMDCWFEKFDIEEFISCNYSDNEIEIMFAPPKDKMASLLELIEKARNK